MAPSGTDHPDPAGARRICVIGGARFTRPLDPGAAKKFGTLAVLGRFWVIGFSKSSRPQRFSEHSATFYLLPGPRWAVIRYLLLFVAGPLLCAWCVFVRGVRIVVAQSPYEAAPAALVKALARLLGRRVVLIVESHGDFEASLFLQRHVRFRALYAWAMHLAAKIGTASADLLRSVSDATGRQLRTWAGPRPIVRFHTWTDLDVFFAAGARRRPGRGILYAGVLTPLKGVDVLIDAFARSRAAGTRLIIIGRSVNITYADALRRRVQEDGLGSDVEFHDHVPQSHLAAALSEAGAFVLPSFSEGMPRVILEAMAVGVPVVATTAGGIPEVIDDGVTGWLVPPRDAGALADRLRWIFTHQGEAEAVGSSARAIALRRFSLAAYRQGYAELLARADEILGVRGDPAPAVQPRPRRG
ncbi:MAG TPA: glycosyltransferase family 4 protein [bacterium]